MVYIGYDYESIPISVVSAKSKELAVAYWQGKEILPHTIQCLEEDFASLDDHPTGVFEILKTKEKTIGSKFEKYRIVVK